MCKSDYTISFHTNSMHNIRKSHKRQQKAHAFYYCKIPCILNNSKIVLD